MKKSIPVVSLVALGLAATTLAVHQAKKSGLHSPRRHFTSSSNDSRSQMLNRIKDYKRWFRVNSKPLYLNHEIAALCVRATPEQASVASKSNPHNRKYFTVYVNAIGRQAMMTAAKPKFPEGSILIKEKLPSPRSKSPDLLTIMIKRQHGYNDANGNWEYVVANGATSKIEARGALANCASCHAYRKDSDYVFRTYLPDQDSDKMR